jgi:phosphate transport system substrate-binding protein
VTVGKKTTSRSRQLGIAALLLAGGCDLGSDPAVPLAGEPAPTFAPTPEATPWAAPVAATAPIAAHEAPAAPQLETAAAGAPAAALVVAIGQNAAEVVDGPLAQGFAASSPGRERNFAPCTDRGAVDLLLVGRADFAVIGSQLSEREQQAGLRQTRFGVELFALAVAKDAPVRSLSRSQVRQILTGEIDNWQQLGLHGGPLVPVVPSDRDLAERAARTLIPGDRFTERAIRVASNRHVADQILQHEGAIGIVRVNGQPMTGMKLVQIDWCPPTQEAFDYGTYPFGIPVQVVTSGPAAGDAQRFLDFVRSNEAHELLAGKLSLP